MSRIMSLPASHLLVQQVERFRRFAAQNFFGEIAHRLFAGEPEDIQHIAFGDFFAAKRDQLIEHRLGVAQAALRSARDRVRGRRLERDLLLPGDELQMLRDQVRRDAMEIESLAAAQDGRQNFLRLGRGENEFHVRAAALPASSAAR